MGRGRYRFVFETPHDHGDTVTIRGYIHNLDKVTHPALRRYTFTCSYNGLFEEREKKIVVPIDSLYVDALDWKMYPNLSKRCKEVIENDWKYRFAAVLMQNRFNLGNRQRFEPEYMEYVNTHFSVNEPLLYFATRNCS